MTFTKVSNKILSSSIYPAKQKPSEQEIKEPTITKIELSQSDLDKSKKVLQSQKMGPMAKQTRQRKIVCICGCGRYS